MCSACSRRRTTCNYSEVDRRRGKLKKDETDALQEKVKSLENIITVLSLSSDNDARDLLHAIRDKAPLPSGVSSQFSEALAMWQASREKDIEFNASVSTNLFAPDKTMCHV